MRIFGNSLKVVTIVSAFVIFVAPSCKRADSGSGQKAGHLPDVKGSVETEVRDFVYPLPTAFEVTEMLMDIGANYILAVTNPASNVDKYFTEKAKALNLGIYAADLSYNSTYQQKQEVMYCMEAIKKLTDDLGVSGVLNQELLKKVEDNINNKDQLISIITNTFFSTYDELNRTGKGNLSLLVVTGSWLEALYITTNISINVYNNLDIVKIIYEQKETLDTLWALLEKGSDDQYIMEIKEDLKPVKDIYDAMGTSLSEEQVNAITDQVYNVREKLVS